MKTAKMMIDVDEGIMKVRTQDEEVCFTLFKDVVYSKQVENGYRMDKKDEDTRSATMRKKDEDVRDAIMRSCWDLSFMRKIGKGRDKG